MITKKQKHYAQSSLNLQCFHAVAQLLGPNFFFLLVDLQTPPTVILRKVEKKILFFFLNILSADSKYYLFR